MEIFFKPTWVHTAHRIKKEITFFPILGNFPTLLLRLKLSPPFFDFLIQYLNFFNSAFQCSESSFSDDHHNPEQTPEQPSQVTLFNYNEVKMDGYLKIGTPSAPKPSKLLTCDQHRTPFLWRSLSSKQFHLISQYIILKN